MLLSLWNLACGAATEACINLRLYSIRILDMNIRLIFAMAIHIPRKPVLILKRFLKRARSPLIFIMRFPIPIIATFLHMFTYLSAVENIVKVLLKQPYTWWRHDMEPVAVLLTLCEVNRLDSPHRGPVINAVFCVFFDVSLNMLLNKKSSYPRFKRYGAHVTSLQRHVSLHQQGLTWARPIQKLVIPTILSTTGSLTQYLPLYCRRAEHSLFCQTVSNDKKFST